MSFTKYQINNTYEFGGVDHILQSVELTRDATLYIFLKTDDDSLVQMTDDGIFSGYVAGTPGTGTSGIDPQTEVEPLNKAVLTASVAQEVDTTSATGFINNITTVFTNSTRDPIVAFDTIESNVGSMADTVNNRILITKDGSYDLESKWAVLDGGDTTIFYTQIIKNGTDILSVASTRTPGTTDIIRVVHDTLPDVPLLAGDYIELRAKRWGSIGVLDTAHTIPNGIRLVVSERPQGTVVYPNTLNVEDTRVLLGSGSGLVSNDTVTISDTWGNLNNTYEKIEFELITTAGSLNIRQSIFINTVSWTDATRAVFYSDAATDTAVVRQMDIAGSTANLFLDGGATTTATMNIYGIKTQKSVVDTVVTVDDQTLSGYLDIGDTRMQWGRATTDGTGQVALIYPQPMLDTTYSFTATAANGNNTAMMYLSDTTTGVQIIARDTAGGAVSTSFSWSVIGPKP